EVLQLLDGANFGLQLAADLGKQAFRRTVVGFFGRADAGSANPVQDTHVGYDGLGHSHTFRERVEGLSHLLPPGIKRRVTGSPVARSAKSSHTHPTTPTPRQTPQSQIRNTRYGYSPTDPLTH